MHKTLELRYYVMLALYFPILLYAVSTFDVSEDTYAVKDYRPISVADTTVMLGEAFEARAFLAVQRLTTTEGKKTKSVRPSLVARGDLSSRENSQLLMDTDDLLAPGDSVRQVSYEAYFEAQQLGGDTRRFPVSGSFTVRRPEIVATSEVTRVLYRQCRNRVRLSVPGLEEPMLRIEGPSGTTTGRAVALTPTEDQTAVDVYLPRPEGEDVFLGEKEFAVIDPPRPSIRTFSARGEVTSGDALPKRQALLRFEVEPDREFQQRYPEDARYEAGQVTVFLRRGLTATQKLGVFPLDEDGRVVLTDELQDAEAGDQVVVRLENVVRVNHRGTRIDVPLGENARTFGFVLS